jgi:glycine/D-amino acid oxidase-like deaminating enzyme
VRRFSAGPPAEAETPFGSVRARTAVVALNAWMEHWKAFRSRVAVRGSYMVITEPAPGLIEEIGWTGGEAITDCRMFLHYFRTTPDGRVLMGSGSGPIGFGGRIDDRFTRDVATGQRAEAGLRKLLPGLAAAGVDQSWGGPIDVSADHLPVFGTVPGTRVHYGAGYTGNGVGPSWLGGQILASLALGADDEWSRLPLVDRPIKRLPPEPINFLGGSLVRTAMLRVEEAAEGGRRASAPSRFVASLPKRLGLRVGTR